MSTKVNDELFRHLEEAEKVEPQREIPVIVTFTKGTDLAALEQKGLKIQRTFENISGVSGTLTAAAIKEVARLDQVERIEFDGEGVWPLENE